MSTELRIKISFKVFGSVVIYNLLHNVIITFILRK